jgi:hypothetical protein
MVVDDDSTTDPKPPSRARSIIARVSASPMPSPLAAGATARVRISASPCVATSANGDPGST